jgi:hypothetical protein
VRSEVPPRFRYSLSQNVPVGRIHDEGAGAELLRRGDRRKHRIFGKAHPENDEQQLSRCGLIAPEVAEFLGFLSHSAFAKLGILLVLFASTILENLNFAVYVCERVCVLLIVHDSSPLTRILLLVRCHYGELKVLVDGETIIDGGAVGSFWSSSVREEDRGGKRLPIRNGDTARPAATLK